MRWWLLLALAALSRAAEEPDLACFRPCSSRSFLCRWPPWGPAGDTTYVLTLCYAAPRLCKEHVAGGRAALSLRPHWLYVLTNATAWVEARWGQHRQRSRNLTLYLDEAVKLDPPSAGAGFSKAAGWLRLRLRRPPCHRGNRPLQREARYRGTDDGVWTQVACGSERRRDGGDGEEEAVSCSLGGSGAVELQLRHKPQHWSSYWSDWSEPIFIPEELLEAPALHHELGHLGGGGQRRLRLRWQPPRRQQGDVRYALRVRMLPCRCAEPAGEEELALGAEATGHELTLCAAAYDVTLTAANAAGPGPPRHLRVPAEQRAELGLAGVSAAGGAVTVRWEAAGSGLAYCFEKQPLAGAPRQDACVRRDFPAKSLHVERASLAESVRINASSDSAVLQWQPSPRAACPGVLKKYIICYGPEGHGLAHGEADAAARRYVLGGLRPGTAYRLGIREVTAEPDGACAARWHFQTKALGPRPAPWKPNLRYLGVLLGLPVLAAVLQLSRRRAARLLCPPLPKPRGSQALRFSAAEMGQGERRKGFVEPAEKFSRAELLVPEPGPEKEGAESRVPSPGPAVPPPSPGAEPPFEYRRQEVPGPAPAAGEDAGLRRPLLPLGTDEPVLLLLRSEGGLDALPERPALP
ncbi:interleukin-12 receptor subunit beta-1 isoform X2 [Dromaius novaehollandiae]|uniref:interleukin-12 receptor subunit beta-1 isoform X2 n=1 Tax=Dromaius novaehollandiae TaxID=8790 RepID=UPI00311F1D9A